MNLTEAKMYTKKTSTIITNPRGYNPYKSPAQSIYEQKKAEEKKRVHEEILRAALQESIV